MRVAIRAAWILAAFLPWALITSLLGGCSTTNLADVLTAASKDPASVCGSVMTPYGNMKFARTNITNGDVTCNQDGLTVRSQPPVVPVGVQVVPVSK